MRTNAQMIRQTLTHIERILKMRGLEHITIEPHDEGTLRHSFDIRFQRYVAGRVVVAGRRQKRHYKKRKE